MVVEVGGGVVDRPRTKGNGDDDQDLDIRRTKRTTAIIIVEAAVAAAVVVVAFALLLRAVVVVVLVVDDFDSSDVVAVVRRLSSSSFMVWFADIWVLWFLLDRSCYLVLLCCSLPAMSSRPQSRRYHYFGSCASSPRPQHHTKYYQLWYHTIT